MRSWGFWGGLGLLMLCTAPIRATAGTEIRGKIFLKGGKQPPLPTIQMSSDPVCEAKHPKPVHSQAVLVNKDGTLRNVFVYISKGLEGKTFPVPKKPAVLDQDGCMYEPHVLGMQAGQPLEILNSDATLHNVRATPRINQGFNLAMPKFVKKRTVTFEKPEVMIPFQCDVHPWMTAYVGVVDNPFFAVTGDGGTFDLKGMPPGTYTIRIWQEICGTQERKVTVRDGEIENVDFTLELPAKP